MTDKELQEWEDEQHEINKIIKWIIPLIVIVSLLIM